MKKLLLAIALLGSLAVQSKAAPVSYIPSTSTYKSNAVINISSGTIRDFTVHRATVTTSLAMSGKKILNLADGTATTDAVAFGQLHLKQIPKFASEATGGSTTSSSFVSTGAVVSITPTSASSKIAIFGLAPCGVATSTDGHTASLGIARNGTELFSRSASPSVIVTGGQSSTHIIPLPIFFLDSPATTSATTYQLMIASGAGSTVNCGGVAGAGLNTYIMVMEVQ